MKTSHGKPDLAVLIAEPKKGGGGRGGPSMGMKTAAQDVMDSMKSGDAAGFADALHAFVQMSYMHGEPDADEGE